MQARDLAALPVRPAGDGFLLFAGFAGRAVGGRGQLVEGLQLLVVAREGVGVLRADGEERARFQRRAG